MARTRTSTTTIVRLLLAACLILSVAATGSVRAQEEGSAEAESDNTAPVIAQPADFTVAAVDALGSVVSYDMPDAADETDSEVEVVCTPPSGSLFPLNKTTTVTCVATDDAGNERPASFLITVADLTAPVVTPPGNIGPLEGGRQSVVYDVTVTDNVDKQLAAACLTASGSAASSGSEFDVGTTEVICSAVDAALNPSVPVTFFVTVNAAPTPVPTATDVPQPTKADPTKTPAPEPTKTPKATGTPKPTETPTATTTPTPTLTATPTQSPTATRVSTPPALALPWPPPESFALVGDGGPLGGLGVMWENRDYPITQEFGHTWFSVRHSSWYAYGRSYGLDGFEHTGLDIGMGRGTPLYSPVAGTVMIAGGTPYFTYYGNGQPGVGELLIQTDDGNQIVLGHMGLITVAVGSRVEFGQLVGLTGGDNGDHLHLEVRHLQPGGGYRIVDPRRSFLITAIEESLAAQAGDGAVASSRRSDEADQPEGTPAPDDDPEETAGPR